MLPTAVLAGLLLAATAPAVPHLVRLARAPAAARRHWLPMWWAAHRWRWLARQCRLAYTDAVNRRAHPLLPLLPWVTSAAADPEPTHRIRWPRARFRLAEHGWTVEVRTIPRVGREEIATAAPWLADAWRCCRVTVHQDVPGRVRLAALRTDPLLTPYPAAACPPGTFDADAFPGRLLLGRDDAARWRHLPLRDVSGITVAGLPGAGKTVAVGGFLAQLAGSPACQPLVLDGKGGVEWAGWAPRAVVLDDDPDRAEDALAAEVREMRRRLAAMPAATGHRNGWHTGPSDAWPLRLVVIDECQTYLDVTARKGDRQAEDRARRLGYLVAELVRKGRAVLVLVVLMTQKPTSDSLPTSIRDNCALALSFALRTTEAAVSALGESIRAYPDMSPIGHLGLAGLCTATLPTGLDPYTRLRCPDLAEADLDARAAATAHLARPLARSTGHLPAAVTSAVPALNGARS